MHGVLVGIIEYDVKQGSLMTIDNLKHAAEPYSYREVEYSWRTPDFPKYKNATFNGYKRKDGRVGTANYWLFVSTVFSENRNHVIKEALDNELGYAVMNIYCIENRLFMVVEANEDFTFEKKSAMDSNNPKVLQGKN
jgi:altronate hydrolase